MPQCVVVVFSAHWAFLFFDLNIPFNSHDTTFPSWHIFKCHNALWLSENSHNTTFHVNAVSLMPQCVVVVFSAQWAFSIFEHNIYTNDLPISVKHFSKAILFADDTSVTVTDKDHDSLKQKTNLALTSLNQWFYINQLVLLSQIKHNKIYT
jgi:hypothetical protein